MNKKTLRDIAILFGVIAIAAIGARYLAGGETLAEYADKNPSAAVAASFEEVTSDDKAAVTISGAGTASTDSNKTATINETKTNNAASNISTPDVSAEPKDRVTYKDGFYYEPISNEVFKRISGISYPVDCQVSLDELRYVGLMYVDFNGESQKGEIICNKAIAQDIVEIFCELYESGYRLESVKLVDEFNGDDEASMEANNTSCFNYRVVEGTTRLSNHAFGRAIDINPFYNPYISYNKDGTTNITPIGSESYADRSAEFPYKIDENDLAYKLFKAHGFTWGGNWNSAKDYQHFEKKG